MTSLLTLNNVTLNYGNNPILECVDLKINEKDLYFFLGNNGSGKSTLVKAILQLIKPAEGFVQSNISFDEIGYVPQKTSLDINFPMTVSEFVDLGFVGLPALPTHEKNERIIWALDLIGMKHLKESDCQKLSGGQLQKLLVTRTLVRKPKLLIADEPTNSMDRHSTEKFMETIFDLNQNHNMAIIFVTHDYLLIEKYAEKTVFFDDRKIQVNDERVLS